MTEIQKDTNQLTDTGAEHKYFSQVPRIVWAKSRNVYDMVLWTVIRDIAGENGECYVPTADLAKLAMMSVGILVESRHYLLKEGLLTGELRRDPEYPLPVWHITIPDLWPQTIAWATEHNTIASRIAAKELSAKADEERKAKKRRKAKARKERSPGETMRSFHGVKQPPTRGEQPPTRGEKKEEPEEEPKQQHTDVAENSSVQEQELLKWKERGFKGDLSLLLENDYKAEIFWKASKTKARDTRQGYVIQAVREGWEPPRLEPVEVRRQLSADGRSLDDFCQVVL